MHSLSEEWLTVGSVDQIVWWTGVSVFCQYSTQWYEADFLLRVSVCQMEWYLGQEMCLQL